MGRRKIRPSKGPFRPEGAGGSWSVYQRRIQNQVSNGLVGQMNSTKFIVSASQRPGVARVHGARERQILENAGVLVSTTRGAQTHPPVYWAEEDVVRFFRWVESSRLLGIVKVRWRKITKTMRGFVVFQKTGTSGDKGIDLLIGHYVEAQLRGLP